MNVKHLHGWTFEVQRNSRSTPHLVQLDIEDPKQVCDCQSFYCRTGSLLKSGRKLNRDSYCTHVKAVALWLFDQNILNEARKGL